MGTRSTIALEFADGTVEQVYCHWDGYLKNNGAILADHYSNPFKAKELVGLGGFSSLRDTVEETAESAYTQRPGHDLVMFGEEISINRYANFDEYVRECQQEEYDYILRQVEGKAVWFVRYYESSGIWITLEQAFLNQEEYAE